MINVDDVANDKVNDDTDFTVDDDHNDFPDISPGYF